MTNPPLPLLLVLPLLLAAAPVAKPLLLPADGALAGIVNDRPARLAIEPSAPSVPVFNPGFVTASGWGPGLFGGQAKIGRTIIKGQTGVQAFTLAGVSFKRRSTWFGRDIVPGFDGAIGPAAVPQPVIRYQLRAAAAGERETRLPLFDLGSNGIGTLVTIDATPVPVMFSLMTADSVATAAAGSVLAAGQDGHFNGPRRTIDVRLGVMRPVRTMALGKPLAIGPLTIASVLVRVGENGEPDNSLADDADPSEIVVTASRPSRVKPFYRIVLGHAELQRCSSLTIDKPAKQIILSCG